MAITYDFAFCTKFRYDALKTNMVNKTRDLINEAMANFSATVQGTARVNEDFVHVRLNCPEDAPTYEIVRTLKGVLSVYLQNQYSEIRDIYNYKNCFDKSYYRAAHGASTQELNNWRDEHPKHALA